MHAAGHQNDAGETAAVQGPGPNGHSIGAAGKVGTLDPQLLVQKSARREGSVAGAARPGLPLVLVFARGAPAGAHAGAGAGARATARHGLLGTLRAAGSCLLRALVNLRNQLERRGVRVR